MARLIILGLLASLVAGCSDAGKDPTGTATGDTPALVGKVRIDGSSTVFPISEAVAEEFNGIEPRVRVSVGVSGTGGGFKKFVNNEIDIAAASRPVKESEFAKAEAAGIAVLELPVAFDGLSVVVNPANDWIDHLTVEELKKIWQPGSTITTWQDVRPEWPANEIRLYGPGTDSGTFDYFTKVINGKEGASRPDYTASEDDNVLVQGIAGDLNGLGYFGFAYYKENADKIRVVAIDSGTGAIEPTEATINDGSYAPLSRPIYIYVNAASLDKPAVASFVDFYVENAGHLSAEVGYIAMPAEVYTRVANRVAQRATGSKYAGSERARDLVAGP